MSVQIDPETIAKFIANTMQANIHGDWFVRRDPLIETLADYFQEHDPDKHDCKLTVDCGVGFHRAEFLEACITGSFKPFFTVIALLENGLQSRAHDPRYPGEPCHCGGEETQVVNGHEFSGSCTCCRDTCLGTGVVGGIPA